MVKKNTHILMINLGVNKESDNLNLRNHLSFFDFNNIKLFPKKNNFMKSLKKIKNNKKFYFSKIKLSDKKLSNRAFAQIKRRIKEYKDKKKDYVFRSDYIGYLLTELIPSNINKQNLKKYTLPLIASFIVTDGHIILRKKKEMDVWEMGFSNKNIELINAFNDLIFLTYDEIPSNIDNSPNIKRTRFVASWHKPMIEEIRSYCYKNNDKSIRKILDCNKKVISECLRIAMSCDGFVTFYISKDKYGFKGKKYYNRIRGSLQLGCKPLELKRDWKKLTDRLGLKFYFQKDRIRCTNYKSLEKFSNQGGFIPKTFIGKDSKYYRNIDKNNVLKTLIMIKKNKLNNIISNNKEQKALIKKVLDKLK